MSVGDCIGKLTLIAFNLKRCQKNKTEPEQASGMGEVRGTRLLNFSAVPV